MTYCPDMSPHEDAGSEPNTFHIGWLDKDHSYPKGEAPGAFAERLSIFCKNPPLKYATLGWHDCEFCGAALEGAEIRLLHEQRIFAAPAGIYHYVDAHQYKPPDEFIESVMRSPLPDSAEYRERFGETVGVYRRRPR
jgi:hypothetical protein